MSKREGKECRVTERAKRSAEGDRGSEHAGATRGRRSLCLIDHANKRRDRERPNPNRALIVRLRADASLPARDRAAETGPSDPPAAGNDHLPPVRGDD